MHFEYAAYSDSPRGPGEHKNFFFMMSAEVFK